MGAIRREMRELAQRRAAIERERDEFRRRGYDNPYGGFGNEQVLGERARRHARRHPAGRGAARRAEPGLPAAPRPLGQRLWRRRALPVPLPRRGRRRRGRLLAPAAASAAAAAVSGRAGASEPRPSLSPPRERGLGPFTGAEASPKGGGEGACSLHPATAPLPDRLRRSVPPPQRGRESALSPRSSRSPPPRAWRRGAR